MNAEATANAEQIVEQLRVLVAMFNCSLDPNERVSLYHGIQRLRELLARRAA